MTNIKIKHIGMGDNSFYFNSCVETEDFLKTIEFQSTSFGQGLEEDIKASVNVLGSQVETEAISINICPSLDFNNINKIIDRTIKEIRG